jgi:hypothetical protein
MKQNIILWIAALVIIFTAVYYKNLTSSYYPVSGSFGIEGEKVTFKFDKIHSGKEDYTVLIRTDKEDLSGYIEWKYEDEDQWQSIPLKTGEEILEGNIPRQPAFTSIIYRVILTHKETSITLPRYENVKLEFRNRVSPAINVLYYFFLLGGLVLALRSGLEYFRENSKVKALSVFTMIFFTLFSFIFSPLRNSYVSGFMGDYIPKPDELFLLRDMAYFLIWLTGFVVLFLFKKIKYSIIITAAVILIYFLITHNQII